MTDQPTERERWIADAAYNAGAEAAWKNGDGTHARFRTFGQWLAGIRRGLLAEAPPRTPEPLTWTREVPTEPCTRVLVRRSDGFVCCGSVEANRHGDLLLRNKDGATGKIYRTYLERFVGMNYHFCVLSIAEPQEGEG